MNHFMETESIQKTLQIFYFTTTYAILMKRTTDIYLNKFFHLAKFWCLFHREYKNVNKQTLNMSQKTNVFLNNEKLWHF